MKQIFEAYNLKDQDFEIENFGNGHINTTLVLKSKEGSQDYVLQLLNNSVFEQPEIIFENVNRAAQYLELKHPKYPFLNHIKTLSGKDCFNFDNKTWRLTKYVSNSVSLNTVSLPKMAFEAAKCFGKLTRNLNGISLTGLKPSISNFHNLEFRFHQFKSAIETGNQERMASVQDHIDFYLSQFYLVATYQEIIQNKNYPDRLVHHDTKINNVIFDAKTEKALCVCDLDTLMPGKIISDLGDMVRTYTCEYLESSIEFDKIKIRPEFFEALYDGYLFEIGEVLTDAEKESLFYAGPFMIYMQGLRFLTDFLNNDIYYPIEYPTQNLDRMINQRCLLEDLLKNEEKLKELIHI